MAQEMIKESLPEILTSDGMYEDSPNSIPVTVVVCVRNEAIRISECLESIISENPRAIIVVDGDSSDSTRELAISKCSLLIHSVHGNLVRDRQIGIDHAYTDFIIMIDADHRLPNGSLKGMLSDIQLTEWELVQSQLKAYKPTSFWVKAEDEIWDLNHNNYGERHIVGGAPSIYAKSLFSKIRYDDSITTLAEDTDFCYRASKLSSVKMGVGRTIVLQEHYPSLGSFLRKYVWYGKADGQFIRKHPEAVIGHLYHLSIRYPLIYTFKAALSGLWRAIPLLIIQGVVRSIFCLYSFSTLTCNVSK